jgi:hypothetical protein
MAHHLDFRRNSPHRFQRPSTAQSHQPLDTSLASSSGTPSWKIHWQKYNRHRLRFIPVADLDLDLHWTLLSTAQWREKKKAREAALHAQRIAEQPEDRKVILVPADSTYSQGSRISGP